MKRLICILIVIIAMPVILVWVKSLSFKEQLMRWFIMMAHGMKPGVDF